MREADSIVGFTGSQVGLFEQQAKILTCMLTDWKNSHPDIQLEFHHGDCIGADAEAAAIARQLGYYIVGYPPDIDTKRAFFPSDMNHIPLPYLVRNRIIVDTSDVMFSAPSSQVHRRRSGTWYTMRYAVKRKKQLRMASTLGTVIEGLNLRALMNRRLL